MRKIILLIVAFTLLFGSVVPTMAAEIYIVQIDDKRYYYVDDVEVTEDEYWQAKATCGWYYDVGILGTKSDGTLLWYGANQVYYSEREAVEGYINSSQGSGCYEMSDGTYIWYWEGKSLESKEEYCELYAKSKGTASGFCSLGDGTRLYFLDGEPYYTEYEYYVAVGYIYTTNEEDGKDAIDQWFDKENSTTSGLIVCKNSPSLLDYYEQKLSESYTENTFMSYRGYIVGRGYNFNDYDAYDGTTWINAAIIEETHGSQVQIEQARKVAKEVADSLRGKSTYDKMKGAYEWLCKNIKYDNSLENHSAYSALVLKKTVCEGYATAYQLIMEELGLECAIVVNTDHAWNAVKYEGKWYWVDATWGDEGKEADLAWFLAGTNKRKNNSEFPIASKSYKVASQKDEASDIGKETEKVPEQVTEEATENPSLPEEPTEEVPTEEVSTEEVATEEVPTEEETTEAEPTEEESTEGPSEEVTEEVEETTEEVAEEATEEATEEVTEKTNIPTEYLVIVIVCLGVFIGAVSLIFKKKRYL